MKKKRTINIIFIIIILLLISLNIVLIINNNKNKKEITTLEREIKIKEKSLKELDLQKKDLESYKNQVEEKYGSVLLVNIDKISFTEYREKVGRETFILVITMSSCGHCERYLPKLDAVLREKNLKAYDLDIEYLSEYEYNKLKEMVTFSGTPTTVIYKIGTDKKEYLYGEKDQNKIRKFIEENYYDEEEN